MHGPESEKHMNQTRTNFFRFFFICFCNIKYKEHKIKSPKLIFNFKREQNNNDKWRRGINFNNNNNKMYPTMGKTFQMKERKNEKEVKKKNSHCHRMATTKRRNIL